MGGVTNNESAVFEPAVLTDIMGKLMSRLRRKYLKKKEV
jgi:hypothetical protein